MALSQLKGLYLLSMNDLSWLSRTSLLIGEENVRKLTQHHVMVVGLGGVGSFAAEFIARSGVGRMTIIDGDVVDPTNRNRNCPHWPPTMGCQKPGLWLSD